MKIKLAASGICLCISAIIGTTDLFAWGQKGHDVTCAVAQRHLTRRAEKRISEIFDGKPMIYWCNWMDSASHTPEYAYTKTWHYKNINEDQTYDEVEPFATGDVVTAITAQVKALKSGELDKEHQALALKMLIHFVGDVHCPMHMAHASDRGGNNRQVQYFGRGTNLHKVWDSSLIESAHQWSYTEWADQIDVLSRKEVEKVVSGTLDDWARESWLTTKAIYEDTPVGAKISYDYSAKWTPVVEQRLLYGGLRLACILNDIF